MKVRTAVPVALSAIVAAGAFAPAVAAPAKPKPITATYEVSGLPVPVPLAGVDGVDGTNSCTNPDLEGVSTTTRTITTKGAGTLKVGLTGFAGDWDITVLDGDDELVAEGAGTTTGGEVPVVGGGNGSLGTDNVEKAEVKLKRATTLKIAVCNFAGGPTATASYTFTYR